MRSLVLPRAPHSCSPSRLLPPPAFFDGYATFARVVSSLFLVLQVLLLVDFAYAMHEFLIARADAADEASGTEPALCSNFWRIAYLGLGFGAFLASFIACIVMYTQFSCFLPTFVISFTLLLVMVMLGLSFSAHGKGLLVAAVVALYCTFLAYSALASFPDTQCNPLAGQTSTWSVVAGIAIAAISLAYSRHVPAGIVRARVGLAQRVPHSVTAASSVRSLFTCCGASEQDVEAGDSRKVRAPAHPGCARR